MPVTGPEGPTQEQSYVPPGQRLPLVTHCGLQICLSVPRGTLTVFVLMSLSWLV